ncbi:MAG: hypothetical protein WA040_04220 [Anaerolineae bacterium]
MAISSNVTDDVAIDLRQLWLLLPKQLPGVVSQKWANGHMGRLEPLIPAIYPNGQPLEGIFCRELDNFKIDDRVVFNWKPAGKIEKDKQNQPDAIEAINVEPAPVAQTNVLINGYHELVATELQAQLKRALKQLRDALAKMPEEIEKQAAQLTNEKRAELDRMIEETQTRHDELISQQAQLDEIVRSQVSELLAKRQLELDEREERLDQLEAHLKRQQEGLRDQKSDVLASRKALAQARAQFEDEGGKAYIEYVRSLESSSDGAHGIAKLTTQLGQFEPKKLALELTKRGYQVNAGQLQRAILAMLTAWSSGQFVILAGPTGVGKTQLVKQLSSLIGAGHGTIAVRPGWVEPADLLGYYNPMHKLFEPTPFLDCLLEADRYAEADRLYALCLDEMNLSRIENYAADLLSRVERIGGGEQAHIDLYSQDVALRLKEVEQELFSAREQLSPEDRAYQHTLTRQLQRYRARFPVARNLVLFGTVNVDETTHMFSPKFLDRAYVLRFEPADLSKPLKTQAPNGKDQPEPWPLALANAAKLCGVAELPAPAGAIWIEFTKWQSEYLAPLGVHFGHRLYAGFNRYLTIASRLGLSDVVGLSDDFFQAKILPRIRFGMDEDALSAEKTRKIDILSNWQARLHDKYPSLSQGLTEMIQRGRSRGVIEFWD